MSIRRRLWRLHAYLAMDVAAVVAQPPFRDDLGQPVWPHDIRDTVAELLTLLDPDLGRVDPGLAAALDGLRRVLTDVGSRPARDWSPADTLALFTTAQTCADHTARVGEFANLWPHPPHPNR